MLAGANWPRPVISPRARVVANTMWLEVHITYRFSSGSVTSVYERKGGSIPFQSTNAGKFNLGRTVTYRVDTKRVSIGP